MGSFYCESKAKNLKIKVQIAFVFAQSADKLGNNSYE